MTDSVFLNEEPALDLTHFAFKHTRNGITIFGTWVKVDTSHRPCLVLIREGEERHDFTVPCVLTLEKAYAFDQYAGNEAVGAAILIEFLEKLRLEPSRQNAFLVFSLINDHLDDLLSIRPFTGADAIKAKSIGSLKISWGIGDIEKDIKVRDV